MLDQLFSLAQQYIPGALPPEAQQQGISQNEVSQVASESMFSGMQNMLQQGGPGALKSLFQGAQSQDPNNPQVQQLTNHFSGNLTEKLGIGSGLAKTIAMAALPMLLSHFFNRTKDPNDSSFSITNVLGSLMGGGNSSGGGLGGMLGSGGNSGGGLGGMLGGMLGGGNAAPAQQQRPSSGLGGMLDRDGDGDTDMADLMAMFR